MATFDLYLNLRPEIGQPAFVRSASSGAAFQFPKVFREGKMALRIFPLVPNPTGGVGAPFTAVDLAGYDCKVAIGSPATGGTAAVELCSESGFTWDAGGFFAGGVLNINTVEMNAVLDAASSPEVARTFEVQIKDGSTEEYTAQASITVRNEVIVDGGGVPTPNTENVFADSMEAILTDSPSVEFARTDNDITANAAVFGDATFSAPLRIEIGDDGGGLANPTTDALAVTVNGVTGRRYSLALRIRGVLEYNTYSGGTRVGDHGYIGGAPVSGTDDTWKLTVSAPAQEFWINHDHTGASDEAIVMDEIVTVLADAGATITLTYDAQGPSFQGNSALLRAPGVSPYPEVFDGHFVDIQLAAAQEVRIGDEVQNRWELTSLTGGTAASLDGIPTKITAGLVIPTNSLCAVVIGGELSHYQLVSGTDAESSPNVIRPDDYNGSTNARVWKLRSGASLLKSGGTMTGQLNFSGTTHAGIKLLSLTTAQRDALTPANGMLIYNSTLNRVQSYEGGAWGSVGSSLELYAESVSSPTPPTAAGSNTVAIGDGASASSSYSTAIGKSNTASEQGAIAAGGQTNTSSGAYSATLGGTINTASAQAAVAFGVRAVADIPGQHSIGSSLANAGESQCSTIPLVVLTSNATPTELVALDGSTRLVLRANTLWHFSMQVAARRASGAGHAAWKVEGAIYRDGTTGSTALLGTPEYSPNSANEAGWDFTVSADTTNGALKLLATGGAYQVRWSASVHLAEITFA